MRKFIFIITFAFMGVYGFSQELKPDQIPQNVIVCLRGSFPQTMDIPVAWTKEKGNYKAAITIMDAPAFMVIDSLGRALRIERRIHENYLPKKAKAHLKTIDPTYQIVNIMQITDDKEKITYKTVAKINTNFTFDSEGNAIRTK
ncbi:MAG: hypothetical protein WCP32_13585 [Bacteroidota bacterium]